MSSPTAPASAGPPGCKASGCRTTSTAPTSCPSSSGRPPVAATAASCWGPTSATLRRAAAFVENALGGWTVAGSITATWPTRTPTAEVLRQIAAARPDVLLVGMGNPLQEQWIHAHRARLDVPLVIGVGGLLNFWSGNVPRAPAWLRRFGAEWLFVLWQQPHKARRYLLGNPLFLARILGDWWRRKIPFPAVVSRRLLRDTRRAVANGGQAGQARALNAFRPPAAAPTTIGGRECHLPGDRSAACGLPGRLRQLVDRDAGHRPAGGRIVPLRPGADRHAAAGPALPLLLAGMAGPGGPRARRPPDAARPARARRAWPRPC